MFPIDPLGVVFGPVVVIVYEPLRAVATADGLSASFVLPRRAAGPGDHARLAGLDRLDGCLHSTPAGMLQLTAPRAGTVRLTFALSLSRIVDVVAGEAPASCAPALVSSPT